jgi:hypothetical protein
MINKLKLKIALSVAKKKYSRNQEASKDFKKFFSESKRILVILPTSATDIVTEAIEILRFFSIHKKELFIIHFKEQNRYLPTDFEFASLTISEEDKTKLGLPNNDLKKKIMKHTFDLVLDLNRDWNIFASSITNIPLSDFRIGFIKENSDSFYNFQIPNENIPEKSYRNLLNSLRMF